MRELELERNRNARLLEELNASQKKTAELQANLDLSSVDLTNGLSSTKRPSSVSSAEESKFYSSMNQLCLASLNVPECTPSDEGDIHRQTFEQWKELLLDNLRLAGVDDELTKFTVFRVKAGNRLLEIFRNTTTQEGFADPETHPFTNAMQRLRSYFGSGSDVMLMRRRLALMFQKAGETDLAFVNRVGSIARLCEYDKDKEFEEIVGAVAEHARDKEVRSAALKLLSRKGSVSELIDKVREIEAIRLNEEYVMQKRGNVEFAQVAAVESGRWAGNQQQRYYNPDGYGYQQDRWQRSGYPSPRGNPYQRGHSYQRGHPYQRGQSYQKGNSFQRGQSSGRRGGQSPKFAAPPKAPDHKVEAQEARKDCCWRCGGQFHSPDNCTSINKICDKCGRRGHIQRACVVGGKRSATEGLENDPREVAAVEKEDERAESSVSNNAE